MIGGLREVLRSVEGDLTTRDLRISKQKTGPGLIRFIIAKTLEYESNKPYCAWPCVQVNQMFLAEKLRFYSYSELVKVLQNKQDHQIPTGTQYKCI